MGEMITNKQKFYIHSLVKKLGWSDEKYRDYIYAHFMKRSSKDLTKREASLLIDYLEDKVLYGEDLYIPEGEIDPEEIEGRL
ncbi:MAG: hypothetical protein CBR30_01730 [Dictyoglomus sp. NZ13-RE01]|nr:MAG: hypothetical protein CBR30_01730 [Dictyoglomus sp. NZ13-RE01]